MILVADWKMGGGVKLLAVVARVGSDDGLGGAGVEGVAEVAWRNFRMERCCWGEFLLTGLHNVLTGLHAVHNRGELLDPLHH